MPKGGKRPGAGRKPGSLTKRTREIAEGAAATGEAPLEFMLRVMRDPRANAAIRADMAKSAAPYIHPRLSATRIESGDGKNNLVPVINVEILRFTDADGNVSADPARAARRGTRFKGHAGGLRQ